MSSLVEAITVPINIKIKGPKKRDPVGVKEALK